MEGSARTFSIDEGREANDSGGKDGKDVMGDHHHGAKLRDE